MKKITFTYEDKDYTLMFTRKTLEKMEAEGVLLSEMQNKPVTTLPKLFEYAFFEKHKKLSKEKIEEMFSLFSNKNEMYNKLSEMAVETLNTLFDEPKEKNAIKWVSE